MKLVEMNEYQYRILNDIVIPALMRSGDEDMAKAMMTLALSYQFKPEPKPENVIAFPGHSVRV